MIRLEQREFNTCRSGGEKIQSSLTPASPQELGGCTPTAAVPHTHLARQTRRQWVNSRKSLPRKSWLVGTLNEYMWRGKYCTSPEKKTLMGFLQQSTRWTEKGEAGRDNRLCTPAGSAFMATRGFRLPNTKAGGPTWNSKCHAIARAQAEGTARPRTLHVPCHERYCPPTSKGQGRKTRTSLSHRGPPQPG